MTEAAPAWTRRPAKAACERRRWPIHAEEYDAPVKMKDRWMRAESDPRPHIGYSCGGQYRPDEWHDPDDPSDYQRFECVRCALGKVLPVSRPRDARRQIKFACPACRQQTLHNPTNVDPELLVLFGEDHVRDTAGNALPLSYDDERGVWVAPDGDVVLGTEA